MAAHGHRRGRKPGRTGLARTVYEALRDDITAGKLEPGAPLSRRQVADRFRCSYTTAVEALLQLGYAGLIEAESAQTARVRRLTPEAIRNVYVFLEAIESQTIRLASAIATKEDVAALYALAEEVDARIARKASPHGDGPLLHWQFHKRIAELSGCPVLVQELERGELLARFQTTWLVTTTRQLDPPRWHSLLVDAVATRDPEAADRAMRGHIRRGLEKELLAYQVSLSG